MEPRSIKRKLAAILSADVQGYSRLMGDDEEHTVRTLTAYRAVFSELVTHHHGRVVDSPGDNLLVEFASAVEAVQCAVRIQQELQQHNARLPLQRRMWFRIGVNLGDVLVEGERIYGDGVNIAARLEGLAEGGGICISGPVYDQVEGKFSFVYHALGEQSVKNIARPVRVYQVRWESTEEQPAPSADTAPEARAPGQLGEQPRRLEHLVGRAAEAAYLEQCLETALHGQRQIVFVTGDPGLGKTTLIDVFLERLRARPEVRLAYGQCVEQYGAGEAYLPLLEAANRLCRGPRGERMIEGLKQYAPTWLAQLPALVDHRELALLQQRVQGTSRERMLREMTEAAELFTARRGLVLVLEDLHWSDTATLEWLAYTARRREPAKLLIIGTYRPAEVLASGHPLKGVVQELLVRGQCEELRLAHLDEQAVSKYLASRFAGTPAPSELIEAIHRRTGGNPLFMVKLVDYLTQQGVVVEEEGRWRFKGEARAVGEGVPDTLRQLIGKQIESLDEEHQRLLEVAGVVGMEFTTAAVAAGLQTAVEALEEQCEQLARRGQFIRSEGFEEWPDGTIGGRYSFLHALYQQVLYERIAEARRVRLHRALALRKEQAYGERASEVAAEFAVHFEAGRDYEKAIRYRGRAAATAVRRHAHREAIDHCAKGLALLAAQPETPARFQQELRLRSVLGASLITIKGYAAPEVEETYAAARELCRRTDDPPQLFPVLWGLFGFYLTRGELEKARQLAEQLYRIARHTREPILDLNASFVWGQVQFHLGDLASAHEHLARAVALYDQQRPNANAFRTVQDAGVASLSVEAGNLWILGYPDQALVLVRQALALAHDLNHPMSIAWAQGYTALIHHLRREKRATRELAGEALRFAREQGLPYWEAMSKLLCGWAQDANAAPEESIAQIRQGLDALQFTGVKLARPSQLGLLAEAYADRGQPEKGLSILDEAITLTEETGERPTEAELYRLAGELLLRRSEGETGGQGDGETFSPSPDLPFARSSPEECFRKAIDIARRQQAKSWELRAALSLVRLWQSQGKGAEARQLLEDSYGWFTEGFETQDLRDAAALLRALGSTVESTGNRQQAPGNGGKIGRRETKDEGTGEQEIGGRGDRQTRDEGTEERERGRRGDETLVTRSPDRPVAQSFSHSQPLTPSTQPLTPSTFLREGEYWTIAFQGSVCRLKDSRGLHYLSLLLRRPNEELPALWIVADDVAPEAAHPGVVSRGGVSDLVDTEERPLTGFSDAGEILDPQARTAYKQRLEDLQAELAEAQEFNDIDRADRLQEEIEFLTRELSQALGLGGRVRKAASPVERARVNVTKAIKSAINKISKSHPALGRHLAQTIRTGTYSSYTPDPRAPISWQT